MCNHTITFHLSETQTTISCPTLHWLSCQDLHRTSCSGVDLIIHHVPQTLVICRTQEDLGHQLPTRKSVVHNFEATRLIAALSKKFGDGVNRDISERRGISFEAAERSNFAELTLDQMGNSHTGRNGVRIDDKIGNKTFAGEWHVFHTVGDTNSTL